MENYSIKSTSTRKGPAKLLSIVVVIALIVVGVYFYQNYTGGKAEIVETLDTGDILTKASGKELVRSFPEELILDKNAIVSESYSINYVNDDINMPVASFESKFSYPEAVAKYGEYIQANGWQVVHAADSAENVTFWYGKRDTEDLNVTFENREGKTFISIAYSKLTE